MPNYGLTLFLRKICTLVLDQVKVLHPNRHQIGHFGNILASQSLGVVLKNLNQTQQKQTIQEQTRKTHKMLNLKNEQK